MNSQPTLAFAVAIWMADAHYVFARQQEIMPDTHRVRISGDLRLGQRMTDEQLTDLARLALRGIDIEYPNKPSQVMTGPESILSPRQLHPAFYGCYDWHSSVHGHWMLVRLLRCYPECPLQEEIRKALDQHLTDEYIRAEAEYFLSKDNRSFERMYGWAWALRLAAELESMDGAEPRRWRETIRPLEKVLLDATAEYLPKLEYPVRTGVHPDTGFALAQCLDYAREVGNRELERLVIQRSRDYFLADRDYPFDYEPSGEDFFSSGMNEADLMRRVLPPDEFGPWLNRFWPGLQSAADAALPQPVEVSDVTDPKLVHLAGLNLSRAWCLDGLARSLPENDPRRPKLRDLADRHAQAGFSYVFSGHYEGEHWLATFAVYALTAETSTGR